MISIQIQKHTILTQLIPDLPSPHKHSVERMFFYSRVEQMPFQKLSFTKCKIAKVYLLNYALKKVTLRQPLLG